MPALLAFEGRKEIRIIKCVEGLRTANWLSDTK